MVKCPIMVASYGYQTKDIEYLWDADKPLSTNKEVYCLHVKLFCFIRLRFLDYFRICNTWLRLGDLSF